MQIPEEKGRKEIGEKLKGDKRKETVEGKEEARGDERMERKEEGERKERKPN